MKTLSLALCLTAAAGVSALPAQNLAANITESKQSYTAIKNNLIGMAEAMPDSGYGFQPTPEIRTFGALMAHVADTNARICGGAMGEQKSVGAAAKTAKADLVAAMKESFSICDASFDALTDANALQPAGMGRTKLGLLNFNTMHDNEEYGYGSIYLRLKSVVPPSTANKKK